jgi:uncharacterized protein YdhG (YjbR/CyaY superfamily)
MGRRQTTVSSIDAYIAGQPPEVRPVLRKIRSTIRKAAPGASETISYRIPAFALNGMLIYFAAFKHHIGLYPPVRGGTESLMKRKAKFEGPKGNLIFPLDQPMPYSLIGSIARLRVRQNLATAAQKDAAKSERGQR